MPQVFDPPSPLCHEFPFLRDVELVERSLTSANKKTDHHNPPPTIQYNEQIGFSVCLQIFYAHLFPQGCGVKWLLEIHFQKDFLSLTACDVLFIHQAGSSDIPLMIYKDQSLFY